MSKWLLNLTFFSIGTFSPDSSDMDVDNTPSGINKKFLGMIKQVDLCFFFYFKVTMQPTRGYSPYNRSQSEEHILSPCRELLKSTEFSPVSCSLSLTNPLLLSTQ